MTSTQAFSIAVVKIWNELPVTVRLATSTISLLSISGLLCSHCLLADTHTHTPEPLNCTELWPH